MIRSFRCEETEKIFNLIRAKKFPSDVQRAALRKLKMLHRSVNLNDLRVPPANHLEKLTGNRQGQWSIRVNDQWRICFRFVGSDAYDVEIVDYH
ncbi:MAG: type II toxin-antitoxin system RelE/ParE family toxin [Thermoguttaceae bacterium]